MIYNCACLKAVQWLTAAILGNIEMVSVIILMQIIMFEFRKKIKRRQMQDISVKMLYKLSPNKPFSLSSDYSTNDKRSVFFSAIFLYFIVGWKKKPEYNTEIHLWHHKLFKEGIFPRAGYLPSKYHTIWNSQGQIPLRWGKKQKKLRIGKKYSFYQPIRRQHSYIWWD